MEEQVRQIERLLYPLPTVQIDTYPPLDAYTKAAQDLETYGVDLDFERLCNVYIREFNNTWFLDIYFVIDNLHDEIETRRFIIAPGCQMEEEDEKEFLSYIHNDFLVNDRLCEGVVEEISTLLPELHLKEYEEFGITLAHCYFASHRSGLRELLFKAGGLECLAMNLYKIEGWDLMANNIEKAFDIPIKMLRKLNSNNAVDAVLRTEESRQLVREVYCKYHYLLNNIDQLNEFQFRYLSDCFERGANTIDKKILNALALLESGWNHDVDEFIDGYKIYNGYMDYQELIDFSEYKSFPKYPSLAMEDTERFWHTYRLLKAYIEHEEAIDKQMEKLSKEWKREYSFEDALYRIVTPHTITDVLDESRHQHNCLYEYIVPIINGSKTIVFLREKKAISKSLVTIEIKDGKIEQALQCCNQVLSFSQMEFLIKFAEAKGLEYKGGVI